ncbi:MAG: NAD-dependent epimerase/dehydratase family protein [Cytophagales bacterium]|nr:MAG: NAD-dependent epimerase/dehydratase family protein [Cytophagales bacterium]
MQTILGAGGTIGSELAKELKKYTSDIRLVSRNPKKVNDTDQLFPADLTDSEQVRKAIAGSEIVYLVVGFEYTIKVWRKEWAKLMKTTIEACKANKAKLVFFDNIYMYDRDFLGNMTEETPIRPTSKKGEVRTEIAKMLMDEVKAGKLTALIARAADFYGPKNEKSFLIEVVPKNFKKGNSANWFANTDKVHSFTFTPDAAKATALLGNTPDAYKQVWHLPTDSQRLTGKQWIALFAKEMNVAPKSFTLPIWLVGVIGWFVPFMKELKEMLYQYDRDYFFNSEKFEKRFGFKPTSYQEGVRKTLEL